MVGEPATTPPTAALHSSAGCLAGAGPPRRPVWRASPPNIANGGEPAAGSPGDCDDDAPPEPAATALAAAPGSGRGSTHKARSQIRGSLQSVSLLQPADRDCAPLQAATETAAVAAASPTPANWMRNR